MKKALSIILCLMMALSCVLAGVSTASAATLTSTGTLNLYKNQTENDVPTEKAGLNGAEFSIYQVMKLNSETGLYSVTDAFKGVVTVDDLATATNTSEGYLTYGNTDKLEAQISTLVAAITDEDSTITATKTATTGGYKDPDNSYAYTDTETTIQAGKATFTNLTQGVYLVRETKVPDGYTVKSTPFLVALTTSTVDANENIVVDAYPKNAAKGELDKVIVTNSGDTQKNDSASIGDTINYKIISQVPDYDTNTLDKIVSGDVKDQDGTTVTPDTVPFFFVDTLSSGLTLDLDSIAVKIGDTEKTKDTDYTVTVDDSYTDGTRFVISFPFSKLYTSKDDNLLGEEVVITYSATLNANAVVASDATDKTNVNDLDLYYVSDPTDYKISLYYDGNNPKPDPDPDPTDEPDDDPVVYTYEMDLTKTLNGGTFSGDNTAVTFSLQYCDTIDGTYADVKVAEATTGTDGSYKVATNGEATITLGEGGTLNIVGLKAGYYQLTEISTLDGYTLLTSPITICVEETKNDEGNVTGTVKANTYKINGNSTVASALETVDGKVGAFAITVNNTKSQFNLPQTGGIGLWIFTIGGAVILAAAVMIFVSVRKKKSAK